ncbi:calcium-binding protein, partial [Sphingomonas sp.]|uniref:calcium-binding protein n=1 Tax=Sphingomonas sp. TaxID=28214 RepID=UPI0031E4898C
MPTFTGTNAYSTYQLEASGVASTLFNNDGSLLYVARRDGKIDVFDTATHGLITTWNVGTTLGGMSLSEDGTFLLVAEKTSGAGGTPGIVHRVSTATGTVQDYMAPNNSFHDVEIVDAHTAIITGPTAQRLNLDTGQFTPLDSAVRYSSARWVLTEDNHLTLIGEPGISSGPSYLYDDRTQSIVARGDTYEFDKGMSGGFVWGIQAVSEAAGLAVQYLYHYTVAVYDLNLDFQRFFTLPSNFIDGLTFDETGTYLYVYQIDQGAVDKYRVSDFSLVERISVTGSDWHNYIGYGDQLHISADGSYISVLDNSSVGRLQLIDLSARNETFAGTADADTFIGRDGNDTYLVGNGDIVVEAQAEGVDTVVTGLVSYTLGSNVENLTLTGSGGSAGTGNDLDNVIDSTAGSGNSVLDGLGGNDVLRSGSGNDRLDGGAGTDTMAGGAGDDTYFVDHAGDIITELAEGGIDRVESSVSYTLGANVEHLTLTGGALNGTGNDLANMIRGNALNNILSGGDGDDLLYGYEGNDTLIGGAGADLLDGWAGKDTVDYSTAALGVTVTLGQAATSARGDSSEGDRLYNIENLTGSIYWDELTGNEVANILLGGGGNDTLTGNGGADVLDGGTGADLMTGGTEDDIYYVDDAGDRVVEQANGGNRDEVR